MKQLLPCPGSLMLVLIAVLSISCGDSGSTANQNGNISGPAPHESVNHSSLFRSEEEYIVHAVISRIARVAGIGAPDSSPAYRPHDIKVSRMDASEDSGPGFAVELTDRTGTSRTIQIEPREYILDPQGYVQAAGDLMKGMGTGTEEEPGDAITDEALLEMLLAYSDTAVHDASKMIGAKIGESPASVKLHEQAAMVAAVFSMREMAGMYSDTRPGLNMACAHLAIARSIGGKSGSGPAATIASIIIKAVCGRTADALDELNGWGPEEDTASPSSLPVWKKVLRARITHDWRPLEPGGEMPPIERVVGYREHSAMVSTSLAFNRYKSDELIAHTDLARSGYNYGHSVQMGHILTEVGLQNELNQIMEIMDVGSLEQLIETMTGIPVTGEQSPAFTEVIPEPVWSLYFQRHLVHMVTGGSRFLRKGFGDEELAQQFDSQMVGMFKDLTIFPIAVHAIKPSEEEAYHFTQRLIHLMQTTPHIIPLPRWIYAFYRIKDPYLIDPASFTGTRPPFGTTENFSFRFRYLKDTAGEKEKLVREAISLDPYDVYLCEDFMNLIYQGRPEPSVIEELSAPLQDYSIQALEWLRDHYKDDPVRYVPYMEKVCLLNPDKLLTFGNYLVRNSEPVMAEKVFENAILESTDAVALSNNLRWLADRYIQSERREEALRVAAIAADSYSMRGLLTYIHVMSHYGFWDEAHEAAVGMDNRYGSPTYLIEFYVSAINTTGREEFRNSLLELEERIFPGGRRTVKLSDFSGPPVAGSLFCEDSDHLTAAGLGKGAVAVAVNGVAVSNNLQYMHAVHSNRSPEIDLVVYFENQYRQVKASPPGKLFGVPITAWDNR